MSPLSRDCPTLSDIKYNLLSSAVQVYTMYGPVVQTGSFSRGDTKALFIFTEVLKSSNWIELNEAVITWSFRLQCSAVQWWEFPVVARWRQWQQSFDCGSWAGAAAQGCLAAFPTHSSIDCLVSILWKVFNYVPSLPSLLSMLLPDPPWWCLAGAPDINDTQWLAGLK